MNEDSENQKRQVEDAYEKEVEKNLTEKRRTQAESLSKKLSRVIKKCIQKFKDTCAWCCWAEEVVEKAESDKKIVDDYIAGGAKGSVPDVKVPVLEKGDCGGEGWSGGEGSSKKGDLPSRTDKKKFEKQPEKERQADNKQTFSEKKPDNTGKENFMARKIRRLEAYKRLMRIRAMQKRREADYRRSVKVRAVKIRDIRAQALRQINPADKNVMAIIKNKVAAKPAGSHVEDLNAPLKHTKNSAAGNVQTASERQTENNKNGSKKVISGSKAGNGRLGGR